MKKVLSNKFFIDFNLFFIPLLLIEIIFRLVSGYSIFTASMIRIIVGLIINCSLFAYICSFCSNKKAKFLNIIVVLALDIYAIVQLGFYNFIGVYGSLQETGQLNAVKEYLIDFFKSFKPEYFTPILAIIFYIIGNILLKKHYKTITKSSIKVNTITFLIIFVLSCSMYYATLTMDIFNNKYQLTSTKELFVTVSNTTTSVANFGVTGFVILDINQKIFPKTIEHKYEPIEPKQEDIPKEKLRGISEEEWDKIVELTTDSRYTSLNEYFRNSYRSSKNDYTGMFKDKNVIFILMESVNDIIVKYKDYYPNFNKMISDGWYFVNNYSPRNSCATLNNELSGMTSIYSISNICTGKEYINNSYFQSVFNLFNKQNYVTFSAHNYTEAYYPRSTLHTNLGSKEYYGVEKLGIPYSNEYKNWSNDTDFVEKILDIIDEKTNDNKPFMTWLTTVSSHQPYGLDSIQGNLYYDMTKNDKLPSDVRRYMSKVKILDLALGELLDGLKERNILDDTVIVLYGDHYPYGIDLDYLNVALDYDTKEDYNSEKVPLVIYNSKMEPKVYEEYTTFINILPTVSNLFDLDYDPGLMLGEDMFDKNYESLVVLANGSWKNENALYDASTNKVKFYNEVYTEDDIKGIIKKVSTKLKISEQAIKTNYFDYLEKALVTIKEQDNQTTSEE